MIQTKEYVEFLIEHRITPNQYMMLDLMYNKSFTLITKFKDALTEGMPILGEEEVESLVDKGFLFKKDGAYLLAAKFLQLYVTGTRAVDEVYDVYPAFITSDKGVKVPLNALDRETFKEAYIPAISGMIKEHKEVLKDIRYAVANNLITVGIHKFLTSKQWKSFRKLRINTTQSTSTKRKVLDKNF